MFLTPTKNIHRKKTSIKLQVDTLEIDHFNAFYTLELTDEPNV